MGRIKNLVFDYILDHKEPLEVTEVMLPNRPVMVPDLQRQVARRITFITNRLPAEPIRNLTLYEHPISIMSVFIHILQTYGVNIRLSAAQKRISTLILLKSV